MSQKGEMTPFESVINKMERVIASIPLLSAEDFRRPTIGTNSLLELPVFLPESFNISIYYSIVLRSFLQKGGRLSAEEFSRLALAAVNRREDLCLCLRSLQTAYMWGYKFDNWAEDDAYSALRVGDVSKLSEALSAGFDPNYRGWGLTPLEMACSEKLYARNLVPVLLSAGATPDGFLVCPPIAVHSHPEDSVIAALVKGKADPNALGYFRKYGHPLLLVSLINKAALLVNSGDSCPPFVFGMDMDKVTDKDMDKDVDMDSKSSPEKRRETDEGRRKRPAVSPSNTMS